MLFPARFELSACFGALFVLAMSLSGCSAGNGSEGRCATSTECSGGRVCLDGRCVRGGVPDAAVDAGRETDAGPDASVDANLPMPVDAGPVCGELGGKGSGEVCCRNARLPSLASARCSLRRSACGVDLMADARKMGGSENWRRLFWN